MSAPGPDEIWNDSVDEGERRLARGSAALAATGVVGGVDVMLGITAMTVVSGALAISVPEQIAHIGGSLAFGIGFVLIVVGRSELFTENFLVPIAAVLHRRGTPGALLRLWLLTFAGNLAALLLLALVLTRAGLVPPETLDAAGRLADTFAERDAAA
ncbi:MAG TPA: formate/nitrite transporter family protein, partial [Burkholderiaceae bacterium]|nr:formate/nitrite transporter family protein [Burkholderiaceae bacterium]